MKTNTLPMWAAVSLAMLALSLPVCSWAQQAAPTDETEEFGAQTRAWVDLQASNNAAMGAARPMPGEVADQVFSRYLKSFTHPIPEYFERDKFVQGSGGSQ
ncbi:MAG: hypothetical protein JWQ90_4856 [Hydrocarboniphaga sp.]|uniref:DUF3613 domain-containing protein n=1 Tax=Hydrocarboniphaga sp. TaxID=2033016 RepID=UPI00260822C2|nr:DUF3613 domain-containing protein [Hydrocarboniphaga sp.]MDB5972406.1 hypothetical protein [Hydrocarboniphaga sp.]